MPSTELILAIGVVLNTLLAFYNIWRLRSQNMAEVKKLDQETRRASSDSDKVDVETALLLLLPLREEVEKLRRESVMLRELNATTLRENGKIIVDLKMQNEKLAKAVEKLLITVATLRECVSQLINQIKNLGVEPVVSLPLEVNDAV